MGKSTRAGGARMGQREAVARLKKLRPPKPRAWISSADAAEAIAWAQRIWRQDRELAEWLDAYGDSLHGRSRALGLTIGLCREWSRDGPPGPNSIPPDELGLLRRQAAWYAAPRGRKPGALGASAEERRAALRKLIFDMYPTGHVRFRALTTKGGRLALIEEHRGAYPEISRNTAYKDLRRIVAELVPKKTGG